MTRSVQDALALARGGVNGCESCHSAQVTQWRLTKHAHAWQSLVDTSSERDPTCISCHTSEVLSVSPSPGITGVSCATCHGPDDLHRTSPKAYAMPRTPPAETCLGCHTPERDPHFDLEPYLAWVRH